MGRSLCYNATPKDEGMRLDTCLAARALYASRSQAAHFIDDGLVFVNGGSAAKKYAVCSGDTIVYEEAEESPHIPMEGQAIDLDVRFEDTYLLVLSKQAGLICHPSPGHPTSTLVNALIHYCGRDNLAHVQGDDRPGIVHRLDGDTSGLMLAAKDDEVGYALQEAIRLRTVDRRYLALVHGSIAHDTGLVDAPIARSERDRTHMQVSDKANARSSVTTFRVLERFEAGPRDEGYTLLECKLYTGRTHQIRVHMKYIKHPCVGDQSYGATGAVSQLGLGRQFLHSYRLDFTHPITGEDQHFVDPLPCDLQEALAQLAQRSTGITPAGTEVYASLAQLGCPSPAQANSR
ncbi:MAG: RluA family pseudouridine synthase [Eggerthellaceae bacterium]